MAILVSLTQTFQAEGEQAVSWHVLGRSDEAGCSREYLATDRLAMSVSFHEFA